MTCDTLLRRTHTRTNVLPQICHLTVEAVEIARQHHVRLVAIPANLTSVLQPLDVGVFKSLSTNCDEAVQLLLSRRQQLTRSTVLSVMQTAIEKTFTAERIRNAWRAAGLYPPDADAVLKSEDFKQSAISSARERAARLAATSGPAPALDEVKRLNKLAAVPERQKQARRRKEAFFPAGADLTSIERSVVDALRSVRSSVTIGRMVVKGGQNVAIGPAEEQKGGQVVESRRSRARRAATVSSRSARSRGAGNAVDDNDANEPDMLETESDSGWSADDGEDGEDDGGDEGGRDGQADPNEIASAHGAAHSVCDACHKTATEDEDATRCSSCLGLIHYGECGGVRASKRGRRAPFVCSECKKHGVIKHA